MNETEFKAKHIVNMHGFYFLQNDASFSIFARPSDRFSWMLCSHGCSWTPDVEGYEEKTKCSLYVVRYVKNNIYSKATLSFFFISKNNQDIKFRLSNCQVKRLTLGNTVLIYYQILITNVKRNVCYSVTRIKISPIGARGHMLLKPNRVDLYVSSLM